MATVLLGSNSPKQAKLGSSTSVNGESIEEADTNDLPEKTTVLIETPDHDFEGNPIPLDKRLSEIRNAFDLHSKEGAVWVEGSDEDFTKMVSQVFNCDVGRPEGWDASEEPQEPLSDLGKEKKDNLVSAVQKVQVEAKEAAKKEEKN